MKKEMKKENLVIEFFRIGSMWAGCGPLIMVIVYSCLHAFGLVDMISVSEMALGVISSLMLAFIAAGISVIWRNEKLPLMWTAFIHASVLFLDYILIYLINGWLPFELLPILFFTGIFVVVYFLIWCCIYYVIRVYVKKMNTKLSHQYNE